MTATRIYLIRHGETEWNKQGIFRGISDVPLNKTGLAQAKAVGRAMSSIPLAAIYSSSLARAKDTAQAISETQKKKKIVYSDGGFIDIHRGKWEGLTHEQAKEQFPAMYEKWFSTPEAVRFPGGERLIDVRERARKSLDRIGREKEGSPVCIVAHHVVIRALLCSVLDVGLSHFRRFEAFPASITELRLEYGNWVLYRLNDVCHLD